VLGGVERPAPLGGNLVYDAQIAAVCREHGVTEILTNDRDFERHGWLNQRPLPDA
jgi:predicted nucleic acid-binding protein